MKLFAWAAALLCALFLISPAFADAVVTAATTAVPPNASQTVTIPFGDWINASAQTIIEIAGAVITIGVAWAVRFLPASLQAFVTTQRIAQAEQLLEKAVAYGVNATAGAEAGKSLTVPVGNEVVANAVNYAIDHGAPALVNWLGGAEAIAQKIIARLPLDAGTQVVTTAASVAIAPASPLAGQPSASPLPSSSSSSLSS